MFIYWLSNLGMGGGGSSGPPLVCYVDPRAVQSITATSDYLAVDPRGCQLLTASSDADFAGVDPRAASLIS